MRTIRDAASRVLAAAMASGACMGETSTTQRSPDWDGLRQAMVERQIRGRGIEDARVLEAMGRVPRHLFVADTLQSRAYDDRPLPIGAGQTISQPYVVAYMTEQLELQPDHRVLEIGTGSGYQAAVLAELVRDVYTIEIVAELADRSRRTLEALGYRNVQVREGNGYLGWPEAAPFERILLTAAPEQVPAALVDQLAIGGLLVAPVGRGDQRITIVRKTDRGAVTRETLPVRFVPMVGAGS